MTIEGGSVGHVNAVIDSRFRVIIKRGWSAQSVHHRIM